MLNSMHKVSSELINIMLRQMGAVVNSDLGSTNIVVFDIDKEFTLKYIYNVKYDEAVYLQRISPYPISRVKFQSEDEVIQFIKEDVTIFDNARKSHNFNSFIELTSRTSDLVESLEDLFLFYNVSKESFQELTDLMNKVHEKLAEIEEKSPRV